MRNLAEASLAFIFAVLKPLRRREWNDRNRIGRFERSRRPFDREVGSDDVEPLLEISNFVFTFSGSERNYFRVVLTKLHSSDNFELLELVTLL